MQTSLESPSIDVTAVQRQQAALEEQTLAQFQTIREVAGSADAAFSFGARASRPGSGALGDRYFATDIGARGGFLYVYNGTGWEIIVGVATGTDAERAAYTPDTTDNGGIFWVTDECKLWEVSGGAWVDRFVEIDVTTSYQVNNVKVVGAQGAAITDYTDNIAGTVANTLAAIPNPADTPATADALRDDLVTNVLPAIRNALSSIASKENTTRARLRASTGHGLIAT